jgi:lytic cellulose monooxygenase (C1-hydroxylating)
VASASVGDGDNWGTRDLNTCCGRMNVKIPSDIPAGEYLLRAEVTALHVASSSGGAQFYMSCCISPLPFPPPLILFHSILIIDHRSNLRNRRRFSKPSSRPIPRRLQSIRSRYPNQLHAAMSTYVAPGPTVYSGERLNPPERLVVGSRRGQRRGRLLALLRRRRGTGLLDIIYE